MKQINGAPSGYRLDALVPKKAIKKSSIALKQTKLGVERTLSLLKWTFTISGLSNSALLSVGELLNYYCLTFLTINLASMTSVG